MPHDTTPHHWLTQVARAAGLDADRSIDVGADADLETAWDLVAEATGRRHGGVADLVASHYRLARADLGSAEPEAHRLVPVAVARELAVVPLRYSDRSLVVATADPVALDAERRLEALAARSVTLEVAAPREIVDALDQAYANVEAAPTPEPAAEGAGRILVVDDDADQRTLLRQALEGAGFGVTEAVDGGSALEELAADAGYTAVTLDFQMGEMDGLTVLERIRSRLATAALPVIVATGSDDPDVEMRLLAAGADDFVVKPVDPPRFLLRLRAVLRRRTPDPLGFLSGGV